MGRSRSPSGLPTSPPGLPARSRGRAARALVAAAAIGATGAAAQPAANVYQLPPVDPGAVATAVVEPPRLAEGPPIFTLHGAAGVRLFSTPSGTLEEAPGEPLFLPITYALSPSLPAGPATVGRLELAWPNGARWDASLVADVRPHPGLRVHVDTDPLAIAPGERIPLTCRIENTGNVGGTVYLRWDVPAGWRVVPTVRELPVAAGETAGYQAWLEAPATARTGSVAFELDPGEARRLIVGCPAVERPIRFTNSP